MAGFVEEILQPRVAGLEGDSGLEVSKGGDEILSLQIGVGEAEVLPTLGRLRGDLVRTEGLRCIVRGQLDATDASKARWPRLPVS